MKLLRIGAILLVFACQHASAKPDEAKLEPRAAGELPGFAYVPAGTLHPGCTYENYQLRAQDDRLRKALHYDYWGQAGKLELPAYFIGRYEVTNAQWKHYLDRAGFKVEYVTTGQETLEDIAKKHVKFRGEGQESEWKAIYAFNHEAIVKALDDKKLWKQGWTPEVPFLTGQPGVEKVVLPKGIELQLYTRRVPTHWYGWCKISGLGAGREYCDIRKPAEDAFVVPQEGFFTTMRPLRAKDFAHYPMRDLSAQEALDFAEWAGCHLPSEYEWERAGRGDRANSSQYPFAGDWDRGKQKTYFAWADNPSVQHGPLPVDTESVAQGDSGFGLRHMLGNVYELTRTFYDMHPFVVPRPPDDDRGLFNYALTAKGGSWGDGWFMMQLSARTGLVGPASLDLRYQNRADSLGFRLVRHTVPGEDLLRHSILKLTYQYGQGYWGTPLPHAYALPRMAGVDRIHIDTAEAPYIHVKEKASGLAFAPLWFTTLDEKRERKAKSEWYQKKATGREFDILGVLRCDVPIRAGVRYTALEQKQLEEAREAYAKAEKEKKKYDKKKKKGDPPFEMPPKPAQPDDYENATHKNEQVGLWREKELPPGEWLVVYWYGFIGLANKAKLVDAILLVEDPRKDIKRERQPGGPATLMLHPEKNAFTLEFSVEEQDTKVQDPPGPVDSSLWALCDVRQEGKDWEGWPGRRPGKASWHFKVTVPVKEGALAEQNWK